MSSVYMRQILESIERAKLVNEGYDDRVNDVVSAIRSANPDGITKNKFAHAVARAGRDTGALEMRDDRVAGTNQKTGDAKSEFIKDVAAKIEFVRDTSKQTEKSARVSQALEELANIIEQEIGNSFPDGDPFDHIAPRARRLGIPMGNLSEWMDRAAKKHLGTKDYHTYLADIWDDFIDGNTGNDEFQGQSNPWR